MDELPIISIALATYNGANFIDEMLASLARQTYPNLEIIVSDDGSSDGTVEKIRSWADRINIKFLDNSARKGIVRNFECAVNACQSNYVLLADQDDYWMPDKIEKLYRFLIQYEAKYGESTPILVFSDLVIADRNLSTISRSFFSATLKSGNALNFSDYVLNNHAPGCAIMFNRALIKRALPYPDVDIHDHWMMQVAALFGEMGYLDEVLLRYRQHGANSVGLGSMSQRGLTRAWQLIADAPSSLGSRRAMWKKRAVSVRRNMIALEERFGAAIPNPADRELIGTILTSRSASAIRRRLHYALTGERRVDIYGIANSLARL